MSLSNLSRLVGSLLLVSGAVGCRTPEVAEPSIVLSVPAKALLDSLYLDEYRAVERYEKVLTVFGDVAPFHDLLPEQYVRLGALLMVYTSFAGTTPDPLARLHPLEVYRDVAGACEVSALFERQALGRYERLLRLPLPHGVPSILRRNRDASVEIDVARTAACS